MTAERLLQGGPAAVAIVPPDHRTDRLERVGAGVDGTPESRCALAAAGELAAPAGGEVEAIGVFDPPDPANPLFAVTSHGYHEILRDLRAAAGDRLQTAVRGTAARPRLLEGEPAAELVRASERLDLLAIGSRGYGPLRTVLTGGTGLAVAARARCPVLVLPRPGRRR